VAPIYYLAGPPTMVDAMTGVLSRAGVRDEDVLSEEFYGY
jgi:Na+-transporting NADH:ubiquinone oxidoreductase subunit NqrF